MDIMSAARVEVIDDNIFDEGFLFKIRKKAGPTVKKSIVKNTGLAGREKPCFCVHR